jgi:hypothetical protein
MCRTTDPGLLTGGVEGRKVAQPVHTGVEVTDDPQQRAEARLQEALERSGARDPREYYRSRLKALREQNRTAYETAVAYYREVLIPGIVEGGEPLAAWTEYGRTLAELHGGGRTVSIDATGRSEAYVSPAPADHLVLHLPDAARDPALLVGLPIELTAAQRATYDWLVQGSNRLRTSDQEAG